MCCAALTREPRRCHIAVVLTTAMSHRRVAAAPRSAPGGGPGPELSARRGGQVLDGHRQMVGGGTGLLGVVHAVRAHGGHERPGYPDGVDAPPDPVLAVGVGRVMPGRG